MRIAFQLIEAQSSCIYPGVFIMLDKLENYDFLEPNQSSPVYEEHILLTFVKKSNRIKVCSGKDVYSVTKMKAYLFEK